MKATSTKDGSKQVRQKYQHVGLKIFGFWFFSETSILAADAELNDNWLEVRVGYYKSTIVNLSQTYLDLIL